MKIPEELLHKITLANEQGAAHDFIKMLVVECQYPSGKVPPSGVTFCRDWLREGLDEDSFSFHLLNLVEIHDDDQGWSLGGIPQGGAGALIDFILGKMSSEDAGWVHTDMYVAYQELVGFAKQVAARHTGLKTPQEAK